MRLLRLVKGDFNFQKKYGIWLVYIVFTIVYVCVLRNLPSVAVPIVGPIMVYTDPAAMGLFFMGAIVLLEKSQRINCSLAVSPITVDEYIISKIGTLMIAGTIIGAVILILGGVEWSLWTFIGVATSSVLFSLCGLFVACKVSSLNAFAMLTVPFELFITLPAILYFFGYFESKWFVLHPGIASIRLVTETGFWNVPNLLVILGWDAVMYFICRRATEKYFKLLGGGSL